VKYSETENKDEWEGPVPEEFTAEDLSQKDQLLLSGFSTWNKRDFYKFINMSELYGRESYDLFADLLLGGKTIEDIQEYAKVFWA